MEDVEEIARAVLYEGYMLYPYRPSSVKNQQRWNFGVLFPPDYCEACAGTESSSLKTECLLRINPSTRVTVNLGFLQIVQRLVARRVPSNRDKDAAGADGYDFVGRLEVGEQIWKPWQEVIEQNVVCRDLDLPSLESGKVLDFKFLRDESIEDLLDGGKSVGVLVRRRSALDGKLQIKAVPCREDIMKISVLVTNSTVAEHASLESEKARDAALMDAFVAAHLVLGVEDGEFLSLLDPLPGCEDLAAGCENRGVWPVLAGEGTSAILASPIILYDHPQIAAESPGNLFDATEIDEILSLRILTLTDEEKQEMRSSDEHARELLERTETISHEEFMRLHGVLRGLTAIEETQK